MDAIRKASGQMTAFFRRDHVAVIEIHVFAHLEQPAKAVHVVNGKASGGDVFRFPHQSTGGFSSTVGIQFQSHAHFLHSRPVAGIGDAHNRIIGAFQMFDVLRAIEGVAFIGVIASGEFSFRIVAVDTP